MVRMADGHNLPLVFGGHPILGCDAELVRALGDVPTRYIAFRAVQDEPAALARSIPGCMRLEVGERLR
jgi:hypothetical protein